MKLNRIEKSIVTSRARKVLQTTLEAKLLSWLCGDDLPFPDHALEIGCGAGQGIEFLRSQLGSSSVTAIDVDAGMLSISKAIVGDAPWATFVEADVCQLPFKSAHFDLVAEFAILHHVPDWQSAIKEIVRVMKPGGNFLFWDIYRAAIVNPISQRLFDHPQNNRFTHIELLMELKNQGLNVVRERSALGLLGMGLCRKVCE